MRLQRRRARAFTLIELLVVIAIIAVLMGLLVPAVQKVREAAAKMSCQNNLKNLALACHSYANDRGNRFPIGAQSVPSPAGTTWLVLILPYIEQDNLYKQYNFAAGYNSNFAVGSVRVPIFYCPSGSDQLSGNGGEVYNGALNPTTHYYGNMGPGTGTLNATTGTSYTVNNSGTNSASSTEGVLLVDTASPGGMGVKISEIKDGTSNTFLAGERSITERTGNSYRTWIRGMNGGNGACKNVTNPINSTVYNGSNNFQDISFGSNHTHGANFAMADGSVRFINDDISLTLYWALASRNGTEVVSGP